MSTKHQQQLGADTYEFSSLWQQAKEQGWYLVPSSARSNEYTVFPPHNHPAALNRWAAMYSSVNYGDKVMIVPHWFYSEIKRSPTHSQSGRYPEEEIPRTVVSSGAAKMFRTIGLSRNGIPKRYV